jgi:hypothetical protein
MEAREHVRKWIEQERAHYADTKYKDGEPNRAMLIDATETEGFSEDGKWMGFLGNYIRRAQLFGIDTLQGRQALGKAIATAMHCLETSVMVYGDMPQPGMSSSDGVKEWVNID